MAQPRDELFTQLRAAADYYRSLRDAMDARAVITQRPYVIVGLPPPPPSRSAPPPPMGPAQPAAKAKAKAKAPPAKAKPKAPLGVIRGLGLHGPPVRAKGPLPGKGVGKGQRHPAKPVQALRALPSSVSPPTPASSTASSEQLHRHTA